MPDNVTPMKSGQGASLFNHKTSSYEWVPADQIADALASGYTSSGSVDSRAEGGLVTRPVNELNAAVTQGETSAGDVAALRGQEARREARLDATSDPVTTFGEGLVDALSLGLVHDTSEEGKLRRTEDSGSALLGMLTGTVVGLGTPGLVSGTTKGGQAAGRAMARALLRDIEAPASRAITRGLEEAGANAAMMGAAAIGHQLTDAVIADKPFSAEVVGHEVGVGALLGFGAGWLGSSFGRIAKGSRDAVEKSGIVAAETKTVEDALGSMRSAWDGAVEQHAQRMGVLEVLSRDGHLPEGFLGNRAVALKEAQKAKAALEKLDVAKGLSSDAKGYASWRQAVENYDDAVRNLDSVMAPNGLERAQISPRQFGDMDPLPAKPKPIDTVAAWNEEGAISPHAFSRDAAMTPERREAFRRIYGREFESVEEGLMREVAEDAGGPFAREMPSGTQVGNTQMRRVAADAMPEEIAASARVPELPRNAGMMEAVPGGTLVGRRTPDVIAPPNIMGQNADDIARIAGPATDRQGAKMAGDMQELRYGMKDTAPVPGQARTVELPRQVVSAADNGAAFTATKRAIDEQKLASAVDGPNGTVNIRNRVEGGLPETATPPGQTVRLKSPTPSPAAAAPAAAKNTGEQIANVFAGAKNAGRDGFVDAMWKNAQEGKAIPRMGGVENALRDAQKAGKLNSRADVEDIVNAHYPQAGGGKTVSGKGSKQADNAPSKDSGDEFYDAEGQLRGEAPPKGGTAEMPKEDLPSMDAKLAKEEGKAAVKRYIDAWFNESSKVAKAQPGDVARAQLEAALNKLEQVGGSRLDSAGALELGKTLNLPPTRSSLGDRLDQVWAIRQAGKYAADEARGVASPLRGGMASAIKNYLLRKGARGAAGAMAGGALAGPLGAALGYAVTSAGFAGSVASSTGRVMGKLAEVGEALLRGPRATVAVKTVAGNRPYQYNDDGPIADPVERIAALQRLAADPDRIRAQVRNQLGDLMLTTPELATAMEENAVRQIQNLSIRAPAIVWDTLGRPIMPTRGSMRKFFEFENATHNVTELLDSIKRGSVTGNQIEALMVQFPMMHAQLVKPLLADRARLSKMSAQQLKNIENVSGIPFTRAAQDPGFTMRMQDGWNSDKQPEPAPGKTQALKITGATTPTPAQSASTGRAPGNR